MRVDEVDEVDEAVDERASDAKYRASARAGDYIVQNYLWATLTPSFSSFPTHMLHEVELKTTLEFVVFFNDIAILGMPQN